MANSHHKKAKTFIDWTLNSAGSPDAEWGSAEWAVGVRLQIQAFLKDRESSITHLSDYYEAMCKSEGWRHLFDPHGHPFTSFELFCVARQPWGLDYDREAIDQIIHERKTAQQMASNPKGLNKNGAVGRGRQNSSSVRRAIKYGETSEYLTARIARDYPGILEEMKEGKYPSVRAAAKAAGIIREPTTLEKAQKLWQKMTAKERAAFQKWISK